MAPVQIGADDSPEATPQDLATEAKARLEDEDGNPTLEAEVIQGFLDGVDFDELFDVDGVADHLEKSDVYVLDGEDGYVEVEEGTDDAELAVLEKMPGAVASDIVDMDDMLAMFEFHAVEEMPDETLEDKARRAVAFALLGLEERGGMPYGKGGKKGKKGMKGKKGSSHNDDDEMGGKYEGVDEKFKRGTFRKLSKQGGSPRALVNRMLGAMMNKQSIQRANKPGTGYKKGDYKKHPAGYSPGTPAGIKKWRKYKTKKGAELAKKAKATKKGLKKLAVAGGTKVKKKAAAKKGASAKKKKKGIAASAPAPVGTVSEGASLAGKMVGQGLGGSRAESVAPASKAKAD